MPLAENQRWPHSLQQKMPKKHPVNLDFALRSIGHLGSGHGHQCHSHAVRACLGATLLRVTTVGFWGFAPWRLPCQRPRRNAMRCLLNLSKNGQEFNIYIYILMITDVPYCTWYTYMNVKQIMNVMCTFSWVQCLHVVLLNFILVPVAGNNKTYLLSLAFKAHRILKASKKTGLDWGHMIFAPSICPVWWFSARVKSRNFELASRKVFLWMAEAQISIRPTSPPTVLRTASLTAHIQFNWPFFVIILESILEGLEIPKAPMKKPSLIALALLSNCLNAHPLSKSPICSKYTNIKICQSRMV